MNKYELVYIVDARSTQEDKDEIQKSVVAAVEKYNGKVINSKVWLEKQKISFPIKKIEEGQYVLLNVESTGEKFAELRRALRLNEKILRFMIILVDERKAAKKEEKPLETASQS